MKKVFFTLLLSAASIAAFTQTTKALFVNGNSVQIGDFDPSSATINGNLQNAGSVSVSPRDFIYDAKNGIALFQNSLNGLIFCSFNAGNLSSKFLLTAFSNMNGMQTSAVAPLYLPAESKVFYFGIQKEFNGYGSNEENLSFTSIDVNSGVNKSMFKITDVSFDNVVAPFYGKISVFDRFEKEVEKEVALSKPLYISEKGIYMVLMRDVTGTNRLYKVKIMMPKAQLIASNRCDYNIIDMAYISGDLVKALYFEKSGTSFILKVGDFNIFTNTMENISTINTFNQYGNTIVEYGSIKFNADHSQLYVSQFDVRTNNTIIYNLDLISNELQGNMKVASGNVQFDFGFSESSYVKSQSYSNVFKLYPNPSQGVVYFKNQSGLVPNLIEVFNSVGQLVKSIEVESFVSDIKIDLSNMAPGLYHIKADMPSEDFIGKVAVSR